ncbi:PIG-L family deacetylase [Verrucomicrobia bacterium]|nr:PIG-L family deacetylase [Verrucomicrobiota bacterium]
MPAKKKSTAEKKNTKQEKRRPVAMAIAAHPDDIEFYMAGTLLKLKEAGYEIHYMNLSRGNQGSVEMDSTTTALTRLKEAKKAAAVLGATFHGPVCNDMEIIFSVPTLKKVSAAIRKAQPEIILTHSPDDYMEDHMETCRIAVTAAFTKGMPNFKSTPNIATSQQDITIYHAMPHSLCDPLRRRVIAGAYVDCSSTHETKLAALKEHASQQNWLDVSQGMNSYLQTLVTFSKVVGKLSGKFKHAEGWRRHLHFGYASKESDPMKKALGKACRINKEYEKALKKGF